MTGTPIEAAAARRIPYAFQYTVPDEFVRLPDPEAVEGWDAALKRLVPDADEEQLASATQQMRATLPGLSAGGEDTVDLTAMCLGTEDVAGEERLSMGLLAVTVRPSGHHDRLLTAEASTGRSTTGSSPARASCRNWTSTWARASRGGRTCSWRSNCPPDRP